MYFKIILMLLISNLTLYVGINRYFVQLHICETLLIFNILRHVFRVSFRIRSMCILAYTVGNRCCLAS